MSGITSPTGYFSFEDSPYHVASRSICSLFRPATNSQPTNEPPNPGTSTVHCARTTTGAGVGRGRSSRDPRTTNHLAEFFVCEGIMCRPSSAVHAAGSRALSQQYRSWTPTRPLLVETEPMEMGPPAAGTRDPDGLFLHHLRAVVVRVLPRPFTLHDTS